MLRFILAHVFLCAEVLTVTKRNVFITPKELLLYLPTLVVGKASLPGMYFIPCTGTEGASIPGVGFSFVPLYDVFYFMQ